MWLRTLASMPLTHIIPYRVSNTYNTRNRVIQFILGLCFYLGLSFIHCVRRSRTVHIHEEPELITSDFITIPFLFLLRVGVSYVVCYRAVSSVVTQRSSPVGRSVT